MDNMKFIGYHGTNVKNIDNICNCGYNFSGKKEWFGKGIYFFEDLMPITNGFIEAKSWAVKVKHFESWAIFQAEIESDSFIDLVCDNDHKQLFRETRDFLFRIHKKSGKDLNEFSDRVVYDFISKENNIELIRVPVNAGKYYGYHSPVIMKYQVQICVKKSDCIKNNILYKSSEKL